MFPPLLLSRLSLLFGTAVCLLVAACTCTPLPRSAVTTVILVRHAEKETGDDPGLTASGQARARALVDAVGDDPLAAIYVTQFRRTRQTAAPAAAAFGIEPTVIPAEGSTEDHGRAVAAHILAHHGGERVLVVGHSNTLPPIIRHLGSAPPAIEETEYDRLFVVTRRSAPATATLREARYGR